MNKIFKWSEEVLLERMKTEKGELWPVDKR